MGGLFISYCARSLLYLTFTQYVGLLRVHVITWCIELVIAPDTGMLGACQKVM
jgi:hypothetical protein